MTRPKTNDMLRVTVIVGEQWHRANLVTGQATTRLDNFETGIRKLVGHLGAPKSQPPDLTDIISQMVPEAAAMGNGELVLVAALWLAVRGRHATISLDSLTAQARHVCLTIRTDDKGTSWQFETGNVDELEAREFVATLH